MDGNTLALTASMADGRRLVMLTILWSVMRIHVTSGHIGTTITGERFGESGRGGEERGWS